MKTYTHTKKGYIATVKALTPDLALFNVTIPDDRGGATTKENFCTSRKYFDRNYA